MLMVILHLITCACGLGSMLFYVWYCFWADDEIYPAELLAASIPACICLAPIAATAWGVRVTVANGTLRSTSFCIALLMAVAALVADMYLSIKKRRTGGYKASSTAYWAVYVYILLVGVVETVFHYALR